MGFFSWKTMNTGRSIANVYSRKPTFLVTMTDNKGNRWVEDDYTGYGVFGGKDFYELLAEMNGKSTRDEGITIAFSGEKHLSPNLYAGDVPYKWVNKAPVICPKQGYFY
jgi:hypothetical protein